MAAHGQWCFQANQNEEACFVFIELNKWRGEQASQAYHELVGKGGVGPSLAVVWAM